MFCEVITTLWKYIRVCSEQIGWEAIFDVRSTSFRSIDIYLTAADQLSLKVVASANRLVWQECIFHTFPAFEHSTIYVMHILLTFQWKDPCIFFSSNFHYSFTVHDFGNSGVSVCQSQTASWFILKQQIWIIILWLYMPSPFLNADSQLYYSRAKSGLSNWNQNLFTCMTD